MNLRHRPVDSPAGPHLAPVEDELLLDWAELRHSISLISVYSEITILIPKCKLFFRGNGIPRPAPIHEVASPTRGGNIRIMKPLSRLRAMAFLLALCSGPAAMQAFGAEEAVEQL